MPAAMVKVVLPWRRGESATPLIVAVLVAANAFKAEPPPKKSRLPLALPVMAPPVRLIVALPRVSLAVVLILRVPPGRLIVVSAEAPPL